MRKPILMLALGILLLQPIPAVLAWELERPDITRFKTGDQRVENCKTNGEASVMLGVDVFEYEDNDGDYGGDDVLSLNISAPANSRKGITYEPTLDSLGWREEADLQGKITRVGVGDDWGSWINFTSGFWFRFFGGSKSGEYNRTWVCSNGFISFDLSELTANNPSNIPSPSAPNAMIAAVWADLVVDSSASIITGLCEIFSHREFVIIWNNVLHKASGKRLTFQIVLQEAPGPNPAPARYSQSYIRLSYKSVSSINTDFTNGIEDHEGYKGFGGLYSGSSLAVLNNQAIKYCQSSDSLFLKSLTIEFYDSTSDSGINILNHTERMGGYHLKYLGSPIPDTDLSFFKALAGSASLGLTIGGLLFTAIGPTWPITLPISCFLITHSFVDYFAKAQYKGVTDVTVSDYPTYPQSASIKALTADYVVDASLSIGAHWVLRTPNTVRHSLTITAKAEYYGYSLSDGSIINKNPVTTSVNLNIGPDDNNSKDGATQIQLFTTYFWQFIGGYDQVDWYWLNHAGYNIVVTVSATSEIQADFDLYLERQDGTIIESSTERGVYTKSVGGYPSWYGPGPWYVKVDWYSPNPGFYKIDVWGWLFSGGSGCPWVSAWNGTQYVFDNNLIPAAEHSNGTDVVDYYSLQQPVARDEGKYSLLISDTDKHSFLDQVKLLAVDHKSDVNVAVSPYGEILNIQKPSKPCYGNQPRRR